MLADETNTKYKRERDRLLAFLSDRVPTVSIYSDWWNQNISKPISKDKHTVMRIAMRDVWWRYHERNKHNWSELEYLLQEKLKSNIGYRIDARDHIDETQLTKLKNATTSRRQLLLIEFLSSTGFRISEAMELHMKQIKSLEGGVFRIDTFSKKTNKPIYRHVPRVLVREIRKAWDDNAPLLFTTSGNKHPTRSYVSNQIKKVGARVGLNVSAHTLRHYWITQQFKKRVPIDEIARQVGHKNVASTYEIYNHFIGGGNNT